MIKMRIDPDTAIGVLAFKPNSLSMSSFCSMLVEYGLERWEKWERIKDAVDQPQSSIMQHERDWGIENVEDGTTEEELKQEDLELEDANFQEVG